MGRLRGKSISQSITTIVNDAVKPEITESGPFAMTLSDSTSLNHSDFLSSHH
jgi:hypothetical protein